MTIVQEGVKRTVDLVIATAVLVVGGPLVLLPVAIAIKVTSPGPVLFRQQRLGRHGRPFCLYKFRSMVAGAPAISNPDGSMYTGADDLRVTRIGRFLRRTSLDELPQFLNVFRGHMSLVGPRPDTAEQLRYYSQADRGKLLVRPGLTGLAQISGRNALAWEERKRLDIEYVRRQSLRLDLQIFVKTIPRVVSGIGIDHTSRMSTDDG